MVCGGVFEVGITKRGVSWVGGARGFSSGTVAGSGAGVVEGAREEARFAFLLVRLKREEKLLWSIVARRIGRRQRFERVFVSGVKSALKGSMVRGMVW